jgi:hypothetical protein
LVAWKKCTRPKRERTPHIRNQNAALLVKHLDKFYNKGIYLGVVMGLKI